MTSFLSQSSARLCYPEVSAGSPVSLALKATPRPRYVAPKPLCLALVGEQASHVPPPLWLMRQAGRYLPEYRAVRERYDTLTMFRTPDLAADITLQPLRRYKALDAAIVYADILLIPDALGCGLSFVAGEGPRFSNPIRTEAHVQELEALVQRSEPQIMEQLSYVFRTLTLVKPHLAPHQALMGFAGAPWTVASYMVEGGGTAGDCFMSKCFLLKRPDLMHRLLRVVTQLTVSYLKEQVKAGCEAIQLFESWGGALAPKEYESFAAPYAHQVLLELSHEVPTIHFVGESAGILSSALPVASHGFGVDWRQPLGQVMTQAGGAKALQGNLDPVLLCGDLGVGLRNHVQDLCRLGLTHGAGFIFNLGHGIRQQTPVEAVELLCEWVKSSVGTAAP